MDGPVHVTRVSHGLLLGTSFFYAASKWITFTDHFHCIHCDLSCKEKLTLNLHPCNVNDGPHPTVSAAVMLSVIPAFDKMSAVLFSLSFCMLYFSSESCLLHPQKLLMLIMNAAIAQKVFIITDNSDYRFISLTSSSYFCSVISTSHKEYVHFLFLSSYDCCKARYLAFGLCIKCI